MMDGKTERVAEKLIDDTVALLGNMIDHRAIDDEILARGGQGLSYREMAVELKTKLMNWQGGLVVARNEDQLCKARKSLAATQQVAEPDALQPIALDGNQ